MSLRDDALVLISMVVPSDYGEPPFALLIDDMYREGPGAGNTCGFLPSFILLMLGCIAPVIVNRNAPAYGLSYHIGENISRLVGGAKQLGAWVHGDEGIHPGDIFFLSNGPPLTEHIGHLVRDDGNVWITADAGQRNATHQAARYVSRPKAPGVLWTPNGWKTIQGYIDIDRLPYNGPKWASSAGSASSPAQPRIFSGGDWMDLEADYLPRVVTQENGFGPPEALKAQAIAARTYLLHAMRDDPTLGTPSKPIPNSQRFQAYAAHASAAAAAATDATRGIVAVWHGRLILANYVAGALIREDGSLGPDVDDTQAYITNNEARTGSDVRPTSQVNKRHPDNRGCMGQNEANWLAAHHHYDYPAILRHFYGADLDLVDLHGAVPVPGPVPVPTAPGPSTSDAGVLPVLVGLGAITFGILGPLGRAVR